MPTGLADMQITWRVDESMTAVLERIISAGDGDFSSRRKLRLLRICQTLCTTTATHNLVASLIVEVYVDKFLYQISGHNGKRLSLFEMVDPETSPVSECQHRLVGLMSDFSAVSAAWELLSSMGCLHI